jgi:hypothetical protein
MESERSLPCSQQATTDIYPEPGESNPQFPPYVSNIHSNVILPSMPNFMWRGTEYNIRWLQMMWAILTNRFT